MINLKSILKQQPNCLSSRASFKSICNRLISLSLAAIMSLSVTSCSQKKDNYDEDINQDTICYDLDEYYVKYSKEYYEYQLPELNSIKYVSNYADFDNYNIYEKPSIELTEILNNNYSFRDEDYPINYDWYNNESIDEELLFKKICNNNINAGIENKKEVVNLKENIGSLDIDID